MLLSPTEKLATPSPQIRIVPDIEMRQSARSSLNRLCDISDWRVGSRLTEIMRELNEGVYIHRKSWEYALCIYGLETLNAVKPQGRAIAIGAGSERPLYYYANRIGEMIATDLYDNADHEGTPVMLTNPEEFRPFDYRREHLTVLAMSGTDLKFPDASFDFAFTLSSIEHFGSRENSKRSVQEMHRVLNTGGIACIATELILNEASHPEYFTIDELQRTILNAAPFQLVGGDLDLTISRSLFENPIDLDIEKDLKVSPHIVLTQHGAVWTSVMLFLQKV